VILYFFGDWVRIIAQGLGINTARGDSRLKLNHMLLWLLIIGTVPVGIAGLLFNKQAEGAWRNPFVIGIMMIGVGILMWVAENTGRQQRDLASVGLPDALAIGAAQALAVVPGTSRKRHYDHRRTVSQSHPRIRGPLFFHAVHAGDRRGGGQGSLRNPQEGRPWHASSPRTTWSALGSAAVTGCNRHRLVSSLPAGGRASSVSCTTGLFSVS